MKIQQTNTQHFQPPVKQNGDTIIKSLAKAKENLSNQMQKLNQDKNIDNETKQNRLKQLQTQIEELEQQIQKRQMEKLMEDTKKSITESSRSNTNSNKTPEEEQKDASTAMSKSLISAFTSKEHLEHLGSIRTRLIAEDGGISERVKRTEEMMNDQASNISKSLYENKRAAQAYAQSSKEVNEKRRAEEKTKNQENTSNAELTTELSENGTTQTETEIQTDHQVRNRRRNESRFVQQESQPPIHNTKTYESKTPNSSIMNDQT